MATIEDERAARVSPTSSDRSLFVDKTVIRRIVAEQNAKSGFMPDPTATAQRGRARMLAQGVKPEDCIGSVGVVAARDEN